MIRKTCLILILLLGLSSIGSAYVIIYPGVTFYGTDITVTVSNPSGINVSYFEVGNKYVRLGAMNLSMSSTSVINISQANSNHIVSKGTSVLRFNATTTSTVTYTFTGNCTNPTYKIYKNGGLLYTKTSNSFTWSYVSGTHDFDIRMEYCSPDPPYAGKYKYTSGLNTINLSWTRGNYSDREIVVCKAGSYPSTHSDGVAYQNSTKTYYNFTINSSSGYFTIWSYNSSTGFYSYTGLDILWGALSINVFNASRTWQKIDPFGLIIQNIAGTDIYIDTSVSPPLNLNLSDIPIGSTTIFILNASKYKQQTFRRDTLINTFNNYTFLLPPLATAVENGTGDEEGNTTSSKLYLITLYNEVDQTIMDGLITFSLYRNETDTYEQTGSFITDGAGQGTIYLIPDKLYKVVCSVPNNDDYQTNTSYWTPSNNVFTKSFKLRYTETPIQPPYLPQDYITFTATRTNTSLTVIYSDALLMTINTTLLTYEINTDTGLETLFDTYTTSDTDSFTYTLNGLNSSNSYRLVLHYNHTIFGRQDPTILLAGYRIPIMQGAEFNALMTRIFGFNPLIWSHLIMFFILVAGMFFADNEDAGKICIILGGLFIFINVFIGFDDALTVAAGGIIPSLMILVGLLMEWKKPKGVD